MATLWFLGQGTYAWTPSVYMQSQSAFIEGWGAGSSGTSNGDGGTYANTTVTIAASGTYILTLGAYSTGATGGGDTSVVDPLSSNVIVAPGGGSATSAVGTVTNAGGFGGSGSFAGGGGAGGPDGVGQNGGNSTGATAGGGGGGSDGGGTGQNASGTTGGNGGTNQSGLAGGAGGTPGVAGGNGVNLGSGGGGGGSGAAGGNGADSWTQGGGGGGGTDGGNAGHGGTPGGGGGTSGDGTNGAGGFALIKITIANDTTDTDQIIVVNNASSVSGSAFSGNFTLYIPSNWPTTANGSGWGPGGNGGNGGGSTHAGGSGAGGSFASGNNISVTAGSTLTVVVPSGGTGVNMSIGSTLVATAGGNGGNAGSSTNGSAGSAGGASTGNVATETGGGGRGGTTSVGAPGGGSAAGVGSSGLLGGNGSGSTGGTGASCPSGGSGGAGGTTTTDAVAGTSNVANGAGGGGGGSTTAIYSSGANGGFPGGGGGAGYGTSGEGGIGGAGGGAILFLSAFPLNLAPFFELTNTYFAPVKGVSQYSSSRYAGTRQSPGFTFSGFQPYGWETQPPQPPHRRPERAASVLKGDDGIEGIFAFNPIILKPFVEIAPTILQWPFSATARAPSKNPEFGDQGIANPFKRFFPAGWESVLTLTYHRPKERTAALMRGPDGTDAKFVKFFPVGWESILPPSYHKPKEHAAAIMRGDDGTEAKYIRFYPSYWEIQSWQPPHFRPESRGAILKGNDGTEGTYTSVVVVTPPLGWEPTQAYLRHLQYHNPEFGDQGIQAKFYAWRNTGWEIQPWQPPHNRPERGGSIMFGDNGIEAPFVFVPPTTPPFGFEPNPFVGIIRVGQRYGATQQSTGFVFPPLWVNYGWEIDGPKVPLVTRVWQRAPGLAGKAQFAIPAVPLPMGWEFQPTQSSYRAALRGAILKGDDGIEGIFSFTPIVTPPLGWESAQAYLRHLQHRNPEFGDQGIQAKFYPWKNTGWEIQPWQPPHFRPEIHGAILRGDDGAEGKFYNWINTGWEIQPWQPPHLRPERDGAVLRGEDGTEAPFIPPFTPITAEFQDGAKVPLLVRAYRRGAILKGDDGVYYRIVTPFKEGWVIQPWQPPHPKPEQRAAGTMRGDDGNQYKFITPFKEGWQIQPWQPPHTFIDKRGAYLKGDDGIYAPYNYIPPPPVTFSPQRFFLVNTGRFTIMGVN